jgi:hypothetical protein
MKSISAFLTKGVIVLVGVSLLAGLALTALPASSVAAAPLPQTGNPPTATPLTGQTADQITARLEKVYQNEQQALTRQETNFGNVDKLTTRVQEVIARLQEKGRDVIPLQTALSVFNAAMAGARSEHDRAVSILASHAGFDAGGKVTDQTLARTTVKDAGAAIKSARLMAQAAAKELRNIVQRIVKAARPARQPAAAPSPTPTPGS